MNRKTWLAFLATQTVGEVCWWTAGCFLSAVGPVLWVSGLALLLPGGLAGEYVLERFFWMRPLTNTQFNVIGVILTLAINAAAWLLCARLYKLLRSRRPSGDPGAGKAAPGHE